MFYAQDHHCHNGGDQKGHKGLTQEAYDRTEAFHGRDHSSHRVQDNQYQGNQNDPDDGPEARELGFIHICLVCHMLRDRNHIFLSADGAPYWSCHDHGKDTAEDPDADDPAQVHI